jgi:hypothetical protein
MVTRAVSARKLLTPLAILSPTLATLVVGVWAVTVWPPLALLAIAAGLTAIAVAGHFTYGVRTSVLVAVYTGAAAFAVAVLYALLSINTSLCGKSVSSAWGWLPPAAGALAFLVVAGWGLRRQHGGWAVALAVGIAFSVSILLFYALPGTQGYCD